MRLRKDVVVAAFAAAATIAVITNAAFLQTGMHPAPLFSGKAATAGPAPVTQKSVRVVGENITGPGIPVVQPKPRPAEAEPTKTEAPIPARPRAEVLSDIQRELTRRGFYDGAPDGVHGPKTDAAIRDFEQASGLRPGSEPNETLLRALMRSPVKAAAAIQATRSDPIAELIAPSLKRVLTVQRALAEYGFGQIRQNGTLDRETKDAIEQFERARKMPVSGQISPRLMRELSAMTGRPLE